MPDTDIAIYTLTSPLHDEKAVGAATQAFLSSLGIGYTLQGANFDEYGSHALDLIYVRTGGTEALFSQQLPRLLRQGGGRPFLLLTSGESNSLAASMEILSYLRQQGIGGEIIHGSADYARRRILLLENVAQARRKLQGWRLGVVGRPSDWLISSHADSHIVKQQLGIDLVDIDMAELQGIIDETPETASAAAVSAEEQIKKVLPGANRIHQALETLVARHRLQGFTIRCFDLLSTRHNTGCLALARLNAAGTVAGCEGDVPALLSMTVAQALLGVPGFQANPARIDTQTGRMLLAHCTIPLNMVERYELLTHFESGMGVGIRGYMKEGPVTLFKVSGDLSRHFVAEGTLVANQAAEGLCRTQQWIELADRSQTDYFLQNPIGNHHIVVPGHHRELLDLFMRSCAEA